MIVKIVSGGQTGADRAALDAAIKFGIAHGGWVPRGRLAEDGTLPATYALKETASRAYAERTAKNVTDSDGTLIISRGPLSGGSAVTRGLAATHGRPCLHVDLGQTAAFRAALEIKAWVVAQNIRVLNVAGPRASKDPRIYPDTLALLESVFYLLLSAQSPREARAEASATASGELRPLPERTKDAVAQLIKDMALKDRVTIANMTAGELPALDRTLGVYIMERFGLEAGNTALIRSCRWVARQPVRTALEAAAVITRELWSHLRRTHPLRRVR
jgi:hypothetical protein